jgi:hypothetical protein
MKVLVTTVTAMAAAAVLLVPVAGSATRPDDRGGLRGPGGAQSAFVENQQELWMDPAIASVVSASASDLPLDPALRAAIQDARSGIIRPDDRPGRREVPLEVPSIVPTGATDSFDWTDAGIGAGAVAAGGLLTLVLAGLVFARHDRRRLGHA